MPKTSRTEKKRRGKIKFLHKPNCTTCRKARGLLQEKGFKLELRDLGRERLTVEELDELIGNRDYRKFLNTRNELYRRRNMAQNPPLRDEALRLMASEPNLIRRPVTICGSEIIIGFDEDALTKLAG